MVRKILSRYLRVSDCDVSFVHNWHGKPYLDNSRHQTRLRFNCSHSKNVVAIAVTLDRDIGIDVEHIDGLDRLPSYRNIRVSRKTQNAEHLRIELDRFYKNWTRLEAVGKAVGRGLPRLACISQQLICYRKFTRTSRSTHRLTGFFMKPDRSVLAKVWLFLSRSGRLLARSRFSKIMCGIVGIFGSGWQKEQLMSMQQTQRHRGPDADGFYFDPGGKCGLGHNRLSIIDLSPTGQQPQTSSDGSLVIVLNGEIYNYLELRNELSSEFEFRTKSDTEVLLMAYRKWGDACLDKLVGMFAFIIWDERNKTAFAAGDRFGVKPLYIHRNKDNIVFLSSEIRALHASGIAREPNVKTWARYLCLGLSD